MIDAERLEHWAASTDIQPGEVSVPVDAHAMSELAREHLALRAIVEAVAAREWYALGWGMDAQYCAFCNCKIGKPHSEGCLKARARALVGAAGGTETR